MASVRRLDRKDGTTTWQVRYRIDGRASGLTWPTEDDAKKFAALVDSVGAKRALEVHGLDDGPARKPKGITVEEWVKHYIDHLPGLDKRTAADYRTYLKNDIGPVLGKIPLVDLSRDDVASWINAMACYGASGKTIANKHGSLLSPALAAAVTAGKIAANPAAGLRMPRTEAGEMRFLSHAEFDAILRATPDYWRPMMRFLVASGARLGEATALRPSDVNRGENTVRIARAWKRHPDGYRIGAPKTARSVRTIDMPADVLDDLNYSGEWLFTNSGRGARSRGGAVRAANFRSNVWWPAVARAKVAAPRPRIHDLRHTCASWMIAAGVPLPVIQRHLGHESIKTTCDRYGHLDREAGKRAAAAIEMALGG
ncbi:tyrosine-type recombinase/integrase [Mycobacterium sp. pUA109]|uniref:tyrosine-type recombinase/integrase n=1 Tax=Mycobacterium sp. pUA109 TaxID=3238982 RepID=UPI00351B30F7